MLLGLNGSPLCSFCMVFEASTSLKDPSTLMLFKPHKTQLKLKEEVISGPHFLCEFQEKKF